MQGLFLILSRFMRRVLCLQGNSVKRWTSKNIFSILYNLGKLHALLLYEDIPHLDKQAATPHTLPLNTFLHGERLSLRPGKLELRVHKRGRHPRPPRPGRHVAEAAVLHDLVAAGVEGK